MVFLQNFLRFFGSILVFLLLDRLIMDIQIIHKSMAQRYGIITLLPKGDKSKHHIKNWRPITLNTVY